MSIVPLLDSFQQRFLRQGQPHLQNQSLLARCPLRIGCTLARRPPHTVALVGHMVVDILRIPPLRTLALAERSRLGQPTALVGHIGLEQLERIALALDIEQGQHTPPHTLALDKLEQLVALGQHIELVPGKLGLVVELGTLAVVELEELDKPVVELELDIVELGLVALFVSLVERTAEPVVELLVFEQLVSLEQFAEQRAVELAAELVQISGSRFEVARWFAVFG